MKHSAGSGPTPVAPRPHAARLAECPSAVAFAAKTTASGLIALLIAFTFNLDQPQWALLTVFIVAQPQSGLVLAKSFYRIIGTFVGASIALLFVDLLDTRSCRHRARAADVTRTRHDGGALARVHGFQGEGTIKLLFLAQKFNPPGSGSRGHRLTLTAT